ncbi:MAG: hypothetical protein Q8J97_06375, partial [Flavobacteriaceae bacterium]|nr:hypothetical protein [Flavobacteriaceae bacterium]
MESKFLEITAEYKKSINMKIDIGNASNFNIDFEEIDAIWEQDLKESRRILEEDLNGESDLLLQEYNRIVAERDQRVADLKSKIKKVEKQIDDEDDKETRKTFSEKKEKLEKELKKEEAREIKRPKSTFKKIEAEERKVKEHAMENGKLLKYIKERIFMTRTDGYYFFEDGKLEFKNEKQFAKLRRKLDAKHPSLARKAVDDVSVTYKCDVLNTDELIDLESKRINLSRRFNFKYDPEAKVDKEKGEELLKFIFEVIAGGKKDQYECVLNI